MRVLVTGGAGFIGSHVCDRLLAESQVAHVRVIDDLSSGRADQVDTANVEFSHASILDPDALHTAASGCDAIVHLAALGSVPRSVRQPARTHEVNATGSLMVLEQARSNDAHVVLASSSAVYGASEELPKREAMRPETMSPYAASKLAMEAYADAYAHAFGLAVLPLRFFNVYGPRQRPNHTYSAVVPSFVEAAVQNRPLVMHGDGTQTRDFTYVSSVAELIVQALVGRVTAGPTNAAFGSRHSVNELACTLERLLGRHLSVEHLPGRAGDVKHSQAAPDLLHQLLPGVVPVPFEDGLRHTISWNTSRVESRVDS